MQRGPVVVDIAGTILTEHERERLRHPLVGGVILFTRNFESGAQLARLCAEIHALRAPQLLICVDQEGGRVQRFRGPGFAGAGPMRELGRLWDDNPREACRRAEAAAHALGGELRAVGVDLSFTPVLDLDWGRSAVIGDRALHRDPSAVTTLARSLMRGLLRAGLASCGKHFPGHGWAEADSHVALPRDGRALDELLAADAAPYRWLGESLLSVMPAHVVYPAVDELPAGFSRRWLQDVLRGRLAYRGLIFSDDLTMEGASVAGDVVARADAALGAGCDMVLVCNRPEWADDLLGRLRWREPAGFQQRLAALFRGR